MEEMIFPLLERRVQASPFAPVTRLREQQQVLQEKTAEAVGLALHEPLSDVGCAVEVLQMLLTAHLAEEERVVMAACVPAKCR